MNFLTRIGHITMKEPRNEHVADLVEWIGRTRDEGVEIGAASPCGHETADSSWPATEVVRLRRVLDAARRVAVYQPAVHAKDQDEADRWAEFYASLVDCEATP